MSKKLKNVDVTGVSTGGGGSEDRFEFKDMKKGGGDSYTASDDLFKFDGVDGQSADSVPTEDFTFNYEEVKWTYSESSGYTATDDLFI